MGGQRAAAVCVHAHHQQLEVLPQALLVEGTPPPPVTLAAATASLERGDARVALHDADMLRGQRAAFNARLLAADPRRRWRDAGAQRFALGPTCARNLLAYVRDPANRDERGRLRLQDGKCTVLGGYGNYQATHAVEAGARGR